MAPLRQVVLAASFLLPFIPLAVAQSPSVAEATATTGSTPSQGTALPSCAQPCMQTAIQEQSCASGDQTCLCNFSTQIQESIHKCLEASSTCSGSDRTSAFEYYPTYCKNLNLAIATDIPTAIATAGGKAPTQVPSSVPSLTLTSQGDDQIRETGSPDSDKNIHAGLQLPAILGIVLAVLVMFLLTTALMVWSFLRRRQVIRSIRMDLGGEFVEPKPRPARSKSVESDFKVQPSPIEKDTFSTDLSRNSTLSPPPPISKDEKRSSADKRNSARGKTLKALLGGAGLRSSLLSSRSGSKQTSLIVPPLDIRKSQEGKLRVSKF